MPPNRTVNETSTLWLTALRRYFVAFAAANLIWEIAQARTPKRIAAKNVELYGRKGIKFIVQGNEKHEVTGHAAPALRRQPMRMRAYSRWMACPKTDKHLAVPDLNVVFPYDEAHARAGLLAK
ncbi:MAG: hypothetical protein K2P94_14250 [Rhodospirillaceae bacterium]|nr:hypothetical protein [Rhodospirillaceae bacterium]